MLHQHVNASLWSMKGHWENSIWSCQTRRLWIYYVNAHWRNNYLGLFYQTIQIDSINKEYKPVANIRSLSLLNLNVDSVDRVMYFKISPWLALVNWVTVSPEPFIKRRSMLLTKKQCCPGIDWVGWWCSNVCSYSPFQCFMGHGHFLIL